MSKRHVAFTIATADYLPQAKAVSDSFLRCNPGYSFVILLLDKVNNRFKTDYFLPARLIEVEELEIPGFLDMVGRYTLFELSNALKPFVAEHLLLDNATTDILLYFDSDIYIYSSLEDVETVLEKSNIVITPHFSSPPPNDGHQLDEKSFLNTGIYNGGFFALKKSEDVISFLKWWKGHMEVECVVDLKQGLFVDQIWLNYVPLYFKNVHILRNPAYNVAYWNLHERAINTQNNQYFVNSALPLVFFHFSGFSVNASGVLSKYQTRYSFSERADVVPIHQQYEQTLLANNYPFFATLTCYYGELKQQWEQQARIEEQEKMGVVNRIKRSVKRRLKTRVDRLLK